jgi:hypothetical protein
MPQRSTAPSPLDKPPGQMAASPMGAPEGEVGDEDSCSGLAVVSSRRVWRLLLGELSSAVSRSLTVASRVATAKSSTGARLLSPRGTSLSKHGRRPGRHCCFASRSDIPRSTTGRAASRSACIDSCSAGLMRQFRARDESAGSRPEHQRRRAPPLLAQSLAEQRSPRRRRADCPHCSGAAQLVVTAPIAWRSRRRAAGPLGRLGSRIDA